MNMNGEVVTLASDLFKQTSVCASLPQLNWLFV